MFQQKNPGICPRKAQTTLAKFKQVTPESGKSYVLQVILIKVPIPISSIEKTPKYPIFYSHFSSFTEQWPTSGSLAPGSLRTRYVSCDGLGKAMVPSATGPK